MTDDPTLQADLLDDRHQCVNREVTPTKILSYDMQLKEILQKHPGGGFLEDFRRIHLIPLKLLRVVFAVASGRVVFAIASGGFCRE